MRVSDAHQCQPLLTTPPPPTMYYQERVPALAGESLLPGPFLSCSVTLGKKGTLLGKKQRGATEPLSITSHRLGSSAPRGQLLNDPHPFHEQDLVDVGRGARKNKF